MTQGGGPGSRSRLVRPRGLVPPRQQHDHVCRRLDRCVAQNATRSTTADDGAAWVRAGWSKAQLPAHRNSALPSLLVCERYLSSCSRLSCFKYYEFQGESQITETLLVSTSKCHCEVHAQSCMQTRHFARQAARQERPLRGAGRAQKGREAWRAPLVRPCRYVYIYICIYIYI